MKDYSFDGLIPIPGAKKLDPSKLRSPNLALLIQKFVEWKPGVKNQSRPPSQEGESISWSMLHNSRQYKRALELSAQYDGILRAYHDRYRAYADRGIIKLYEYRLKSRLVIGLGSADVREVGFTLHRHGFPYIPGSALKGAARAVAELIEKASQEDIREVFGWTPDPKQGLKDACMGRAAFWDAIPLPGQRLLELDVMNPHFPTYYHTEGKGPPAEWDSPIPLYFLAVPAGTVFLFAIEADKAVQAKALRWLDLALTQLGIGAKTTLGYGLWTRITSAKKY